MSEEARSKKAIAIVHSVLGTEELFEITFTLENGSVVLHGGPNFCGKNGYFATELIVRIHDSICTVCTKE